jgi:hypothetical protein
MHLFRKGAASLAAGLLLVGVTSSPANAVSDSQTRIGVRVADANGSCADGSAENTHVKVCFDPGSDRLYVKDKDTDGRSAYGMFDGGWVGDRDACRNPYGAGTWVMCDYDLQEYIMAKYQGFTQDNEGTFNFERDHTNWDYECTTLGGC